MTVKGQIIAGDFSKIIIRQKSTSPIEIGELLVIDNVIDNHTKKIILQATDLEFGSQISKLNLEMVSGMHLEEETDFEINDKELRSYNLVSLKPLITSTKDGIKPCKTLPLFFSEVRGIQDDDIDFLTKPKNPLFVGTLRSGSKALASKVYLPSDKVLSHHILIAATTGKGKSNLTSIMLWSLLESNGCAAVVLDPHDEYYGRNSLGLKDHPQNKKVVYYTAKDPPPGTRTLKIHLSSIKPKHFQGVINFSDPQQQAMQAYYRTFKETWIQAILEDQPLEHLTFMEGTIQVVKRVLMGLLNLSILDGQIYARGIFDPDQGKHTIRDICNELESTNTVIIDTSIFSGSIEILIGSLIANEVLARSRRYKMQGELKDQPVISIVLEEAPRVLGKEILERGSNIFATIAREGRKFKIGLIAITQLPSLIPRPILANMNTKIILGIDMNPERQAIIESSAQDLSQDSRQIASLDRGEAIITSSFTRFAIPIKIPLFKDVIAETKNNKTNYNNNFSGIDLS